MEFKDVMDKLDIEIKKWEQVIKDGLTKQEKGLEGSAQTIGQVKDAMAKAEEKILALEAEKKDLDKRLSEIEVKAARPDFGKPDPAPRMATPGQRFILSDQYQGARDRKSVNAIDACDIGSLFEKKQVPGALRGDLPPDRAPVWAQREPEIIFEPGQRIIRLFDLMASSPTGSNSIEYFREEAVGPGPGSQKTETAGKKQLEINFVKMNTPVETIAGWLPASRQVLEDAPALQSYIDGRLTYAVMAEAERQLLFGTGVAGQLIGIMNTPGVQVFPAPVGAQTNIDIVRLAIAAIAVNDYMATGIVLNPQDWAAIELTKGGDLHYIWVQVPNGGEMRLWRVPVVESNVMQQGQYLVGSFGLGAKVWDRQAATIRTSDSHADYFVRNAIAILGEMRLALAVYRPTAFVKGKFDTFISS
jgi:hypothetical protein